MSPRIVSGRLVLALVAALAAAIIGPRLSWAQGLALEEGPTFWDLVLGLPWSEQPQMFQEFACGTNGGPPSVPLAGFGDYMTCPPEPTGLREVRFEYDDELEYWARAMEFPQLVERYAGTRVFTFPVVVSALFDDAGILRGLRAVSDDRVSISVRQRAYTLAIYSKARFGSDGWTCVNLPAGPGEEPMGALFIKEDCGKVTVDGWTVLISARYLRKPGQTLVDPFDNTIRVGYFESIGRVELYDAGVAVALPVPGNG